MLAQWFSVNSVFSAVKEVYCVFYFFVATLTIFLNRETFKHYSYQFSWLALLLFVISFWMFVLSFYFEENVLEFGIALLFSIVITREYLYQID